MSRPCRGPVPGSVVAVSQRTLGRSCHSARLAVSQRTLGRVAAHARPCLALCHTSRVAAPLCALLRISQLPALYCGASPSRVALVSRHNPAAKPLTCHDMPIRIVTQSPSCQALARTLLALARWPAVSQGLSAVSQAESSAVLWPNPAVSWPTMRTCCALCHDAVY